ncbi:hypothetical protein [Bacillus wiedmannii]|uniref:hypothetical protein n=1 Tax=Bacillus wiedmannii TaxID=1890302 RepID=UPI000BEC555A|nr:hypothetical protein [Bacillus wiedmannii]PDZ44088.1 hypothetical protein CON82_20435 [Bacillus wiedmannii]
MNAFDGQGPTGELPFSVLSAAASSLQTSSIPITPVQLTQLETIVFSLNTQAQAYVNNPNSPNLQALEQVFIQLYAKWFVFLRICSVYTISLFRSTKCY